MPIEERPFGKTHDGKPVKAFTLRNDRGMSAEVITYGATLIALKAPDKEGHFADVTLGFDTIEQYQKAEGYIGATIGRVANRTAKACFTLEGKEYQLAANDGENHLHGGQVGFDKRIWETQPVDDAEGPGIQLLYSSPDGEENYPGKLDVVVTYHLLHDNTLRIDYAASTDAPTPVNLTNHAYWNLAGHTGETILGHRLEIEADAYTPIDTTLIPNGEIAALDGTPLDFRKSTIIGDRIKQLPGGYDHNYALREADPTLTLAARLHEEITGRIMEVWTTEPGLQFYSGNFLDGTLKGKHGITYKQHTGLCLEAQHFPNAANESNFASIILTPGQTYMQRTEHRFFTD